MAARRFSEEDMMKIAIVYASETGNTAQIAQAIREGCQGHAVSYTHLTLPTKLEV